MKLDLFIIMIDTYGLWLPMWMLYPRHWKALKADVMFYDWQLVIVW